MPKLTDAEKDTWDTLKYGPPVYELYCVNTYKKDSRIIEIYGYVNLSNKREYKVQIAVDGLLLEKNNFKYWPDGLSLRDSYPTCCQVSINYPIEFDCTITMSM